MSAAAAPARLSALAGLSQNWARQGAESAAAALKIISDLTAQEVALLIGMVRERVNRNALASGVELSGRVVTGYAEAGKIMLDLASGETVVLAEGLKEVLRLGPSFAALVDFVPRGVETVVGLQKSLLDTISEQTQEAVEAYKEGRPVINPLGAAKMVREGVERFIQTQKTLLDIVTEQVNIATTVSSESKPFKKSRTSAAIHAAGEGVEKFIAAQKEVLEMVLQRAEEEEKRARVKPEPTTSLAELTRKSVQNITTAQKSLLDLALRPVAAASKAEKPRPAARRKAKATRKTAATAPAAG